MHVYVWDSGLLKKPRSIGGGDIGDREKHFLPSSDTNSASVIVEDEAMMGDIPFMNQLLRLLTVGTKSQFDRRHVVVVWLAGSSSKDLVAALLMCDRYNTSS